MGKELLGWSSSEVVVNATLQLDAGSLHSATGYSQGSVLVSTFIHNWERAHLLSFSDDAKLRSAVSMLQSRVVTWKHLGRLGEEHEIQQGLA